MRAGYRGTLILIVAQATYGLPLSYVRAEESAASQPAEPDEGEPLAPSGNRQPMHLNIADLWIGMGSDYDFRRVRTSGDSWGLFAPRSSTQTNRDFQLQEKMGLSLAGDLYDPNLFDYHSTLEFGLDQERNKQTSNWYQTQSDSDSGGLSEWDFSADILKNKPISFNVFTRRADLRVPRSFLPSLHEQQTEAGVSALAQTGQVTTEAGYTYRDTRTHNNQYQADNETVTLSRFYVDSKWTISDAQSLHVSFDNEREKDDYQGSLYRFDTTRDELRIDHDLRFGDHQQHRLDTYLLYNADSGDLAYNEFELVPRVTLQHTDKFKTVYRYGYYQYDQDAIETKQHKVDVEALYQATKELRLSTDTYGLYERLDNEIDTNQYGISGDATYQKPTSYGDFSADLNLSYDQAHTTGTAGRRLVRNEAHALGTIRPAVLRQQHVVIWSIVGHNDGLTRVYVPGVDFAVIPVGDHVMITRVPWGRIAENSIVYFDYQYEVPADAQANTYRVDFRIEHAFKNGITPYYYYQGQFQQVDANSLGTPIYNENQNRHQLGLRYGKDLWSVTGEYEFYDATVEPYDAVHFTGQANLFRSIEHSLDLRGEVSHYWYQGSSRNWYDEFLWYPGSSSYWGGYGYGSYRVWYFDLDLKDRYQINNFLSLTGGAEFRYEDDTSRGITRGADVHAGLQYTRGQLTVELNVEYDALAVIESRSSGLGIFLNMKRDLTDVIPPNLRGGAR